MNDYRTGAMEALSSGAAIGFKTESKLISDLGKAAKRVPLYSKWDGPNRPVRAEKRSHHVKVPTNFYQGGWSRRVGN